MLYVEANEDLSSVVELAVFSKHPCRYHGGPNGASNQTLPPLCEMKKTSSPHTGQLVLKQALLSLVRFPEKSLTCEFAGVLHPPLMWRGCSVLYITEFDGVTASTASTHNCSIQIILSWLSPKNFTLLFGAALKRPGHSASPPNCFQALVKPLAGM